MNTALILGGGAAGRRAALRLADKGYTVIIVGAETEPAKDHPSIRLYAGARLLGLQGASGGFTAEIDLADGHPPVALKAGAVILTPDYYGYDPGGLPAVAERLGIALNDYGLVAVHQFCPVLTTRAGVFTVGGGKAAPTAGELAAQADTAASLAAQILGEDSLEP